MGYLIRFTLIFLAVIIIISTWNVVQAFDYVSPNVTFSVQAINEIAVSGNLAISKVKTNQLMKVIDATSTYLITTNEVNKKITGVLNTVLPKGSHLSIALEAPTGAISAGSVDLKTTPVDLVTGVTKVAETERIITYEFSAPIATQLEAPLSQVVTLTITN